MILISFKMARCSWLYSALYLNDTHISIKDGGQVGTQGPWVWGGRYTAHRPGRVTRQSGGRWGGAHHPTRTPGQLSKAHLQ